MARRLIGLDIGTNAVTIAEVTRRATRRASTCSRRSRSPRDAMREGEVADEAAVTDAVARLRDRGRPEEGRRCASASRARASSCARSRCR